MSTTMLRKEDVQRKWYVLDAAGKPLGKTAVLAADLLRGKRKPDYHRIVRLCELFGCSFSDITGADIVYDMSGETRQIPVLGYVRAGEPNTAVQNIIGYENVNEELARTGELFGLKIRGDSMEPKMSDGDIVIVKKQPTAENGQIAVVMRGNEDATVKRITFRGDGITLTPFNTAYKPIHYSKLECKNLPVTVVGVVVELRCKFI